MRYMRITMRPFTRRKRVPKERLLFSTIETLSTIRAIVCFITRGANGARGRAFSRPSIGGKALCLVRVLREAPASPRHMQRQT